MKLKIVSDGTPRGSAVMTEAGEIVENVQCADIHISGTEVKATLKFLLIEVEVIADCKLKEKIVATTDHYTGLAWRARIKV